MLKVDKTPNIKCIQIQNSTYRVQEIANQASTSYFTDNSWSSKQQGLNQKKNFNKTREKQRVYQDKQGPQQVEKEEQEYQVHGQYRVKQQQKQQEPSLEKPIEKIEKQVEQQQQQQQKQQQRQVVQKQQQYQEVQKQQQYQEVQKQQQYQEVQKQQPKQQEQVQQPKQQEQVQVDIDQDEEENRPSNKNYTHFVSIPLNFAELIKTTNTFNKEFINIEPKLQKYMQDTRRIHVTLLMLKLDSQKKIERAQRVLTNLTDKIQVIIQQSVREKFVIGLKGIGSFGLGPRNARVLYFKVGEGQQIIQDIVNVIVKEFMSAKLIRADELDYIIQKEDSYSLEQMHITLFKTQMNDEYFEANKILAQFRNIDAGEYEIHRLDISKFTEFDQSGYYQALTTIKI